MMKKSALTIILCSLSVLLVHAQNIGSGSASQAVSVIINSAVDMNLSSSATRSISFDALADYDNGIEVLNSNTINYKTNRAWKISVKALSSDFTNGAPNTRMPASVIGVRKNGSSNYITVSSNDQEIASGARDVNKFNIDYKANPGYGYEAGTYTVTLQYTMTNQ